MKNKIMLLLIAICLLSTMVYIGYIVESVIFAFSNPELTTTMISKRFLFETAGGKWTLCSVISYLIVFFMHNN